MNVELVENAEVAHPMDTRPVPVVISGPGVGKPPRTRRIFDSGEGRLNIELSQNGRTDPLYKHQIGSRFHFGPRAFSYTPHKAPFKAPSSGA